MEVKIGPPFLEEINPLTDRKEKIPYIAFHDVEEKSVTFNPLFVKENPRKTQRIAAHEGAHRAIDRGYHEIGLSREKIQELQSSAYLGFHSFNNIGLTDPRVNNWDTRRFPGLVELNKEIYDEQLKEENVRFIVPEVNLIISRLGRYPRYAEAASELVRFWHQKRYSKKLEPEIEKFLKRVQEDATKYQETIPDPDKHLNEEEVITIAQECFRLYHEYIWPEVKKLVEMDLHTEEQRQMSNEFRKKQKELEQKRKELEDAKASGDQERQEELQKEIEGLKKELDPFNQLPENVKKELQKEIDKAIQDSLEKMQQESEGIPYPEDKLSEKTKQELEKLFQKLPKSKKQELKDKAQKQLEGFEDAVNKKLEGKLNEDKPETHQERREKENKEREAARKSREAKVGRERIEKELERIRKERMTPYEQARAEVVGLIDNLYFRLRRIFRPEEYGEEEAGYPVGQRLDISRAMQAEKDVEQKRKLWIRETAPAKKDCRFWHLVDLSNSMADKKIKETFKGFIIAGEAIDRLENLNSATTTVHQGITGFHNRIFPIKKINQRFTKEVEDGLSTMPERTLDADSGTNTYSATLVALENLKQHRGETGNFLLTFSDGEPNRDIRNNLKELLRKGKEERERLKIKVGLIWLGEFKDEEKLKELVKEYGYDFGLVMQAIKPSLEEKAAGKKDFSEALADLLEDLIEHPEKY